MSEIRETHIDSMNIKLVGKAKKAIVVPPDLFEIPGVMVAVAKRGSGKTTAIASLLRDYHAAGFLDRLWVLSPTISSAINAKLFEGLPLAEGDKHTEMTFEVFQKVLDDIEEEGEEWAGYKRRVELYKRLVKYARRGDWDAAPADLLVEADRLGMLEGEELEKPKSRYGHHPRLFVFLDDCQGSRLMSQSTKNPLANVAIRQRHIGGGVGATLIIAIQNYASAAGGIPRYLRENATLYMCWRLASEGRRQQLAKELSNDVEETEFSQIYDYATSDVDPYGFLTIDLCAPKARRFRKNFDVVLELAKKVG